MARVAVGAGWDLGVVRILHATTFLGDPLAGFPIAEILAVFRPLDGGEIAFFDAFRDILRQRLARVFAAGLLRVVLGESVKLRLALLPERGLEHRGRLR